MIDNLITIGRLLKAHGTKGFIKLELFSGELERLSSLDTLWLSQEGSTPHLFHIENIKPFSSKVVLISFKECPSLEEVKKLVHYHVLSERKNGSHLQENEFYYADLSQCQVIHNGEAIGSVVNLFEVGNKLMLEVQLIKEPRKVLIPFLSQFIGNVFIEEKKIELLHLWIIE